MTKIITSTFAGVIFVALIVLLTIEQGWAISTLWGWFLVPLGLPEIGIAMAIGVAATASAIKSRALRNKSDKSDAWKDIVAIALQPLVCVTVGWIAKQFL